MMGSMLTADRDVRISHEYSYLPVMSWLRDGVHSGWT